LRKNGKLNVVQDQPASARARKAQHEQTSLAVHAPDPNQTNASEPHRDMQKVFPGRPFYADSFESSAPFPFTELSTSVDLAAPTNDLLARKLEQLHMYEAPTDNKNFVTSPACVADDDAIALLLAEDSDEDGAKTTETENESRHAPLVAANMIDSVTQKVILQYGLLGSYEKKRILLNTNIPFSAFVCGVQGSGKSHTTACILENALIPSPQLGRLERPLSASIFSYG
jgi:hypothetical protein